MSFYPEPDSHSRNKIKFELDLSGYSTNCDIGQASGFDISEFAKKVVLSSLKSNANKLDADKLNTAPAEYCKLINVVGKTLLKILYMMNWLKC